MSFENLPAFRELTRKSKQISREECTEILIKETRGTLAVNGDGGYPYALPMNHFYNAQDGCIYFHCGRCGHKLDAIRESDKVSFCVCEKGVREEGDWAYTVRSVIVFGRIQIIDDAQEVVRIARELCYKFTHNEEYIQKGSTASRRRLCF
jgi:nitroimidazol reductase NimA-like FMN-containing flavoprotein (pyridoxamine 5'-phosphate oxidase superfamily)